MENNKFIDLGKNFYNWYRADKIKFTVSDHSTGLESEIKRVAELIDYAQEKKQLQG